MSRDSAPVMESVGQIPRSRLVLRRCNDSNDSRVRHVRPHRPPKKTPCSRPRPRPQKPIRYSQESLQNRDGREYIDKAAFSSQTKVELPSSAELWLELRANNAAFVPTVRLPRSSGLHIGCEQQTLGIQHRSNDNNCGSGDAQACVPAARSTLCYRAAEFVPAARRPASEDLTQAESDPHPVSYDAPPQKDSNASDPENTPSEAPAAPLVPGDVLTPPSSTKDGIEDCEVLWYRDILQREADEIRRKEDERRRDRRRALMAEIVRAAETRLLQRCFPRAFEWYRQQALAAREWDLNHPIEAAAKRERAARNPWPPGV